MQPNLSLRSALLVPLLLPLLAAGLARPGAAGACSVILYPPWKNATYFLATPSADTALAGGLPPQTDDPERVVRDSGRPVYGQAVRLLRVGGDSLALLEPLLARGAAEAVLVPWENDPACRPAPWRRSFRWAEPGKTGLYRASLRDRAHWVDGRPTFDVFFAGAEPYPRTTAALQPGRRHLSPEELFALYAILPTHREIDADPGRAYAPLLRWARANPEAALRYPADDMVSNAVESLHRDSLRGFRSPLAGTYRVTLSVPGRRDVRLTLRAGDVAGPWAYDRGRPDSVDELLRTAARGYSLAAMVSTPGGWRSQTALNVLGGPAAGPRGERVWRGRLDVPWPDPNAPAEVRQALQAFRGMLDGRPEGWSPATIRLGRDGRVTFEQALERDGRVVARVRGERISADVRPGRAGSR